MLIDRIDKLELPNSELEMRFNELRSLDYLAKGLRFLYEQVRGVEVEVLKRLPGTKRFITSLCHSR